MNVAPWRTGKRSALPWMKRHQVIRTGSHKSVGQSAVKRGFGASEIQGTSGNRDARYYLINY